MIAAHHPEYDVIVDYLTPSGTISIKYSASKLLYVRVDEVLQLVVSTRNVKGKAVIGQEDPIHVVLPYSGGNINNKVIADILSSKLVAGNCIDNLLEGQYTYTTRFVEPVR
jgi:hypothetical protein